MKKRNIKKLDLKKTTVQNLNTQQQQAVQGGSAITGCHCVTSLEPKRSCTCALVCSGNSCYVSGQICCA
jgi:hypothetical protein